LEGLPEAKVTAATHAVGLKCRTSAQTLVFIRNCRQDVCEGGCGCAAVIVVSTQQFLREQSAFLNSWRSVPTKPREDQMVTRGSFDFYALKGFERSSSKPFLFCLFAVLPASGELTTS
jgi:hypothetical protein